MRKQGRSGGWRAGLVVLVVMGCGHRVSPQADTGIAAQGGSGGSGRLGAGALEPQRPAGDPPPSVPAARAMPADSGTSRIDAPAAENPERPPSCPAGPPLARPGGRTFHVCDCGQGADSDCRPGNDASDGLQPASAWRTLQKARGQFAALRAGDSIAFCRGGLFPLGGGRSWVNGNCRADRPCVVRDYPAPWASGNEGRPVWLDTTGGHGITLEDGGPSDHEEGYVFANLELRGRNTGSGIYIFNDVDDVLLDNLVIQGFDIGVHAAGSNPPGPGSDGRNARIVLRNSRIAGNPNQGYLGSSDDSTIECNSFENNGAGSAIFNHNLYLSAHAPVPRMRVRGNDLYRSTSINGRCKGVSLVVHGQFDQLLIDGNTVREEVGAADPECWGIAVDTGYPEGERFSNVIIRGNRVLNLGNAGIGLNACSHCLVENNLIVHEQPFFSTAILAPDRARDAVDQAMTHLIVRNNSIVATARAGGGVGISLGEEGTGHVVVSNAISYEGTRKDWSCFKLPLAAAAYQAVDHNVCSSGPGAWAEWRDGRGDLERWRRASGFDGSSRALDPRFSRTVAPGYDLAPALDSPLLRAGHPSLSAKLDIAGRLRSPTPAAGAFDR
jgi:hypothetical protein